MSDESGKSESALVRCEKGRVAVPGPQAFEEECADRNPCRKSRHEAFNVRLAMGGCVGICGPDCRSHVGLKHSKREAFGRSAAGQRYPVQPRAFDDGKSHYRRILVR